MADNLDELSNLLKQGELSLEQKQKFAEDILSRAPQININTGEPDLRRFQNLGKQKERLDNAIISTADNTENIRDLLKAESKERKTADNENMEYTTKMDARNHRLSVWALIIAIAGVVVTLVQLFESPIRSFLRSIFG